MGTEWFILYNFTRVKVFAIEMVYIPAGSFYIGDGATMTDPNVCCEFANNGSSGPLLISSSLTPNVMSGQDTFSDCSDDTQTQAIGIGGSGVWAGLDTTNSGSIDKPNFPTGYNPFYLMKYELTEGQWVDFFNTLNSSQKSARDITGINGKNSQSVVSRNTIAWPGSGNATTTRPDRACGFLSWMDLCAYADWAGLRPMTELEYEKAARGPNIPVYSEFAWGDTSGISANTISGSENGTETITNPGANAANGTDSGFTGGDGGYGPLRVGIFANSASTRHDAGAGYYGNMELYGNVNEQTISVGLAAGRDFQGTQGDGSLTSAGYATNTDWPGYISGSGVSNAAGNGFRGNSFGGAYSSGLSDRESQNSQDNSRYPSYGIRCARTAL